MLVGFPAFRSPQRGPAALWRANSSARHAFGAEDILPLLPPLRCTIPVYRSGMKTVACSISCCLYSSLAGIGGWGGIRTRETIHHRLHTFQACAFNRSATHPSGARTLAEAADGRNRAATPRDFTENRSDTDCGSRVI